MLCDSSIINILSTLSVARLRDRCTNPSKTALFLENHYIFASLVKGEVLSPERIRATTGGIATPLSPRLRKPFQNRTIPCFAPSRLPPLSKVRCCRPKEFGRLPEGLSHQPFQNRTIPRPAPRPCHMNALPVSHPHYPSPCTTTFASLVKGEVLSPKRIRATTGGIAFLPHPFRFLDTSVTIPQ